VIKIANLGVKDCPYKPQDDPEVKYDSEIKSRDKIEKNSPCYECNKILC